MIRPFRLAVLLAFVVAAPLRPAPAKDPSQQPDIAASRSAWPVIAGLLNRLEESARLLGDGQRGCAMKALNASLRLAEAGSSIAKGLSLSAAHDGLETVRQARRSVQNGAPDKAVRDMSEAASRLRRLIEIGLAEADSATTVVDRATEPRAGLQLLALQGDVLGEIDEIVETEDGPKVVIETGRWVNLLGFFNVAAEEAEVPSDQFLYGRKAAIWLNAAP